MFELCTPAIIYVIFSITQILIDTFKGLYNTAFMKIIVMIMITFLLNVLCQNGLGVVSWIIVFIPFIMMTVIVTFLLYIFGLNSTTGSINYQCEKQNQIICNEKIKIDKSGNIIIYDPNYDSINNPVKFKNSYLIVPNPDIKKVDINDKNHPITWLSSSPAYQS